MPNAVAHGEFVAFMAEYTAFLTRMKKDESDKLAALSSRELVRIEQSIAISQANAKRLENFETKRVVLQKAAGYDGLTFRQLIEQVPPAEQDHLWQLFTRFENNVAEIRFFNDKSMAVARDNMMEIDPSAVLAEQAPEGANNPYGRIQKEQSEKTSLLETKA